MRAEHQPLHTITCSSFSLSYKWPVNHLAQNICASVCTRVFSERGAIEFYWRTRLLMRTRAGHIRACAECFEWFIFCKEASAHWAQSKRDYRRRRKAPTAAEEKVGRTRMYDNLVVGQFVGLFWGSVPSRVSECGKRTTGNRPVLNALEWRSLLICAV